jgi:hypothetical protein
MKKIGLFFLSILSMNYFVYTQPEIIINEFSQGSSGSKEWIEIVITANGADIRGVYCADDDGTGGFSNPDFELKTDLASFSSVNKGSIIVIYNSSAKDETLPADDSDFSDGKIVIPHNNATFIESGSTWPALRNDGDNFGLFTSAGAGIHGISFGDQDPTSDFDVGWGQADITSVGVNTVANFIEDTPAEGGTGWNWSTQTSTSASPGSLNGGNNNNLPVELSSFSAVIINGSIKLNWRTETEVNNYGFDILRQAQDDRREKIGFVDGYGNTNSPKQYAFIDDNVISGKYAYRLKQIDNDGTFEYSKIIEVDMNAPIGYELSQNYPNPFNPETTIKFAIPKSGLVKLSFYNILGELKGTLVNEFKEAGIHTVNINALGLSSGIYVYKLEVDDYIQIRKMTLIK